MPRDPKISLESQPVQDQIAATKLAIEKARLAKLEGELPETTPQYTRYEDLPPPPPEERAGMEAEFMAIFERLKAEQEAEKKAWYLSMVDFAP